MSCLPHQMAKLIGAPPGYAGYEDGGQLTKRLLDCPRAVVLLDDVDKCHPDIMSCLLQTFDEGRLTDGQGNTVNCTEATFLMTTDMGQVEVGVRRGP